MKRALVFVGLFFTAWTAQYTVVRGDMPWCIVDTLGNYLCLYQNTYQAQSACDSDTACVTIAPHP